MTVLVLPAVLLPLLWGKNDAIPTARTLLTALALPVFLGGFAGTVVSGKNPWVKDYYGVPPITATLPMTTAQLVGAKLKAAALSALATWVLLIVVTSLAVVLTGNLDEVAGWWWQAGHEYERGKIVAAILTVVVLLFVWTWKQVVDSLLLGLTGRKWVIQGTIMVGFAGFAVLCFTGLWIYRHPETHETFLAVLPWLLGLVVLCRLLAAGWVLQRLMRRHLLAPRTAARWLAAWLLLASLSVSILAWSVPAEVVPLHYVAFAVVFVLPLARLTAAPLALAWNRHR